MKDNGTGRTAIFSFASRKRHGDSCNFLSCNEPPYSSVLNLVCFNQSTRDDMWISGRSEPGVSTWWLAVIKCLLGVSHPAQPFAQAALESWQQPCVCPSPASLLPMSNWSAKWPWECLQLLISISGNQGLEAGGRIGQRIVDMHCLEGPGGMTKLAVGAEYQVRTRS